MRFAIASACAGSRMQSYSTYWTRLEKFPVVAALRGPRRMRVPAPAPGRRRSCARDRYHQPFGFPARIQARLQRRLRVRAACFRPTGASSQRGRCTGAGLEGRKGLLRQARSALKRRRIAAERGPYPLAPQLSGHGDEHARACACQRRHVRSKSLIQST